MHIHCHPPEVFNLPTVACEELQQTILVFALRTLHNKVNSIILLHLSNVSKKGRKNRFSAYRRVPINHTCNYPVFIVNVAVGDATLTMMLKIHTLATFVEAQ